MGAFWMIGSGRAANQWAVSWLESGRGFRTRIVVGARGLLRFLHDRCVYQLEEPPPPSESPPL